MLRKDKLITWLEAAERAAKSSASRSSVKAIGDMWNAEAVEIRTTINEITTGQLDLAQINKSK